MMDYLYPRRMKFWKPGAVAPGEEVTLDEEEASTVLLAAMIPSKGQLPVHKHRNEFLYLVENHQVVIVVGQTGSGKTTQLPQYLFEAGWTSTTCMVACTQPRRVAAISVATRVAEEMSCEVGGLVGYSVRFDEKSSPMTGIKYLTDGMLFREALFDPLLSRYSVVMIDEAHERSLYTDLLLGLLKKIIKKRKDLRIIISSATMDAEAFKTYFTRDSNHLADSAILTVQGRMHPVDVFYLREETHDVVEEASSTIVKIHANEDSGDILVFLPGKDEIDRCIALLEGGAGAVLSKDRRRLFPLPLHAALPLEQQMRCFEATGKGVRKVIIATNIAETSVTIEGIVYVVDSGRVKQKIFNPQTGLDVLLLTSISQASAQQRAGRAGRLCPGKAYRLYTEDQYDSLLRNTIPEIQKCNPTNVILQLKALGIGNILAFDFMSQPATDSMARSLEFLHAIHALDSNSQLTMMGEVMSELPVEATLGRMLIASAEYHCGAEMCILAAMLSAGPVFVNVSGHLRGALDEAKRRLGVEQGDLVTLINIYRSYQKHDGKWCQRHFLSHKTLQKATRIHALFQKYMQRYGLSMIRSNSVIPVQKCIASGLFAQAALAQADGTYRSIRDNTVLHIHPSSVLFKRVPECVVFQNVLQTSKIWMRDVTVVDLEWLAEIAPKYYEFQRDYRNSTDYDELAKLIPRGFGKEAPESDGLTESRLAETRRLESPAIAKRPAAEELQEYSIELPVTHSITLKQHRKTISALSLDKSGARLAVGSHDYTLSLWDFGGMDHTLSPFRYLEPTEGCPLRFLQFSPASDWLLVGGGGTPVLLDRHGALVMEYAKGDPYLRDMRKTAGHVSAVTAGKWYGEDRFVTAGLDGTVRFWDAEKKNCETVLVVRPQGKTGGRSPGVTALAMMPDNTNLCVATADGSIRIYSTKGPWLHADSMVSDAHNGETSCLAIDSSGRYITSRGADDTLKLWDVRSFSKPIGVVNDLPNTNDETSCVFSPDQNLIATCVSARKGKSSGSVAFFDTVSLEAVTEPVCIGDSSAVSLLWPTVLNQLIVGCGDGNVQMLYDPQLSQKGAILPLSRSNVKKKESMMAFTVGGIQTPNALPLFKTLEGRSLKRIRIKMRKDPRSSSRPEMPVDGPGTGGRLGSSVTQSIMRNVLRDTRRDEDPREALLRYAERAEKDPKFVTPAYKETQPTTILDAELLEKEALAAEKKQKEEEAAAILTRKIQSK
ncbi:hypothetical protein PSACC_00395, partial [Paramicrosporidium saccamoebae]